MKSPLWIVAVCFYLLPVISSADGDSYKWVLKQYDAKDDSVLNSEEGQMGGEHFLAVIVKREIGLLLAVFRRDSIRYVGIGQMDLPDSPPFLSTVEIAKNSIFVETSFCHHGCTDTRYQFKKFDSLLRLVGIESQNETWCSYYDEKNAPPDCNNSVRSGNSYNLLSSTTICWSEIEPEGKAPSKLPRQYQPRGVQHKLTFSKVELPLLDGFNLDKFTLPKSCYFDYKKVVHVYVPNP
jgi:hypothetical protein